MLTLTLLLIHCKTKTYWDFCFRRELQNISYCVSLLFCAHTLSVLNPLLKASRRPLRSVETLSTKTDQSRNWPLPFCQQFSIDEREATALSKVISNTLKSRAEHLFSNLHWGFIPLVLWKKSLLKLK